MASNKGSLKQTQQQEQQQIAYGMMHSTCFMPENFSSRETAAYDLGEILDDALLYLEGHDHASVSDQRQSSGGIRPTLSIFPSQPMHVEPSTKIWQFEEEEEGDERMQLVPTTKGTVDFVPTSNSSKRPSEASMEYLAHHRNDPASAPQPGKDAKVVAKREVKQKGLTSSSEHEGSKTPDPKTLRRLAQNREAARKSRLRKKVSESIEDYAYVQQLESSRIKLNLLEQELQRARAQGLFLGGGLNGEQGLPTGIGGLSSDAVIFDMEYARWLEEHHQLMCELQAAVQDHLQDNELRMLVDSCLAHYDQMMNLKNMMVRADVFHIVSGMWKTPAERCFMWLGDFRPSELIKMILNRIQPLMEQQILGICSLQQSTQEAEEALTKGLEALNQSLSDTITSDALSYPSDVANYMGQMAIAMNKLSTLEGFVRQADNLRQQTLHRIHQILTPCQAAQCCLAIAEYFHRLRALSSLWLSRPRHE